MRPVIWVGLVTLTVAGCASAPTAISGLGVAGRTAAAPEPTLVGTYWQLTSYREPAAAKPVPVNIDSTLSLTVKGNVSVHACNYFGATARTGPATLTVAPGISSTAIGCSGEGGEVERQVEAMLDAGTVRWSIRDRVLTLSSRDGRVLTYRVRPAPYPDLHARTLAAGKLAGGDWRLAAGRSEGHLYMAFETRTEPGAAWGQSMIMAPADCLASGVMEGGVLGGRHYVAAWATPKVGKVIVRATPASAERTLPFHAVPDSSLRIAGAWLDDFRSSFSTVTFHDRAGAVITAYPKGPCRHSGEPSRDRRRSGNR